MDSFLNLLYHEFVLFIILFYFLKKNISFGILYLYFVLFLLYGIWETQPLFIISCFMGVESYALSRCRCWYCFLIFLAVDTNVVGRLITLLSMISVTTFITWVFAADITQHKMAYPFYLLMYAFAPGCFYLCSLTFCSYPTIKQTLSM